MNWWINQMKSSPNQSSKNGRKLLYKEINDYIGMKETWDIGRMKRMKRWMMNEWMKRWGMNEEWKRRGENEKEKWFWKSEKEDVHKKVIHKRWTKKEASFLCMLHMGIDVCKEYITHSLFPGSSVGWGCKIHLQHLCRGIVSSNDCPRYDIEQSNGEAPIILELWEMWSTSSLPLFRGLFMPGVVAPERVLSMGQIELFGTQTERKQTTYARLDCLK